MKAVGFTRSLPVTDERCLIDLDLPVPEPGPRQLLVRVAASSVNPADAKRRRRAAVGRDLPAPIVLGYDAVGKVVATGQDARLFQVGDKIWYSGSIHLPGSNAEYQLVDERIAGRRPSSLDDAAAAALPLTALTAWEALFDRLRLVAESESGRSLLIIGGAGGVGSIAIQLARLIPDLTVIATASRPETQDWCRRQGVHMVVDHSQLVESMGALGFKTVDYILNCADTSRYWAAMAELIRPEGRIASIVEPSGPIDLGLLMLKSATFVWENMTTRPFFSLDTMQRQHQILTELAVLVDANKIRSTLTRTLHGLTSATLRDAHRAIESGHTVGKIAVVY
jgi:NADPH2:quinone reductase